MPSFTAPLSWREEIAGTPEHVSARGVFFNTIANELRENGHDEKPRLAFKLYPMTELMDLEVRAAGILYPGIPIREGLRRLGHLMYPALLSTTAGRVLFSVAGLDFRIALTLASKAYGLAMTHGTCELRDMHKDSARLILKDVYNFVDSTQVGVFEGAMQAFGVSGRVLTKSSGSSNSMELMIEWE